MHYCKCYTTALKNEAWHRLNDQMAMQPATCIATCCMQWTCAVSRLLNLLSNFQASGREFANQLLVVCA